MAPLPPRDPQRDLQRVYRAPSHRSLADLAHVSCQCLALNLEYSSMDQESKSRELVVGPGVHTKLVIPIRNERSVATLR